MGLECEDCEQYYEIDGTIIIDEIVRDSEE